MFVDCAPGAFAANEPVDVCIGDTLLTSGRARPDGSFRSQTTNLPLAVGPGAHTVCVRSASGDEFELPIVVVESAAGAAGDNLPSTGRDIALLVFWALVLLTGGMFLIAATWRHWREARAQRVAVAGGSGLEWMDTSGYEPFTAATWRDRAAQPGGEPSSAQAAEPDAPAEPAAPADDPIDRASERLSGVVKRLQDEVERWDDQR